ncbi:MAG TPA: hypothetical protein PLI07_15340, partial [Candidatus Hydrogenedentes bacterium]|nr:hypothetical protein [Candidatus Hydrogenedentota bacterium]
VTMRQGVAIYGGFAGTESTRDQRNPSLYVATIDGANARRGVTLSSRSTLDGFTIIRGKATNGGGLYAVNCADCRISDCAFISNSAVGGGGAYVNNSSATIDRCLFKYNSARGINGENGYSNFYSYSSPNPVVRTPSTPGSGAGGGAAVIGGSLPVTISNCRFENNSATGGNGGNGAYNSYEKECIASVVNGANGGNAYGGAIAQSGATVLQLVNCVFWKNRAQGGMGGSPGYALVCYGFPGMPGRALGGAANVERIRAVNSTFEGNAVSSQLQASGGAIWCSSSGSVEIANSILFNNMDEIYGASGAIAATYSDIEGGFAGEGRSPSRRMRRPL